jgi:hypothetical protein
VLRAHCDEAGPDYDAIEKTTIFAIDPDASDARGCRCPGHRACWPLAGAVAGPRP